MFTSEGMAETAATTLDQVTMDDFRHVVAMYEHALIFVCSIDGEFEFGLGLILDGLEPTVANRPRPHERRR